MFGIDFTKAAAIVDRMFQEGVLNQNPNLTFKVIHANERGCVKAREAIARAAEAEYKG